MNEIASRYAYGLYSLALDENKVNEWQEECRTIFKLLKENAAFLSLISNAFLSLEEKEEIIDQTFKGCTKEILNLIKLLIKHHREKHILDTLQAFNSLANSYRGVKEGLIYSTIKLEEDTLNRINKEIGKKEGIEVELYNIIDPSLIGGVKVVIDGHIYDGSVQSYISNLKSKLTK